MIKKINLENKRGGLLSENVVKLVIAVISISLLIWFLTSLYYSRLKLGNQKKAKNILETSKGSLKNAIDEFKENDSEKSIIFSAFADTPEGWYLFTFTHANPKPRVCNYKKCICICENVWKVSVKSLWTSEGERQAKECSDNGYCIVEENLAIVSEKDETEIKMQVENGITELHLIKWNNGRIQILGEN